jgi:hypothetical protein
MLTSHSRSVASSTSEHHHSARAMAGRSDISRTRARGMSTTRQGDRVAMEWSMALQDEDVQVAEVARDQVGHDVAPAVLQ